MRNFLSFLQLNNINTTFPDTFMHIHYQNLLNKALRLIFDHTETISDNFRSSLEIEDYV